MYIYIFLIHNLPNIFYKDVKGYTIRITFNNVFIKMMKIIPDLSCVAKDRKII